MGWLIVEDILTVVVLVLIPVLGPAGAGGAPGPGVEPGDRPGSSSWRSWASSFVLGGRRAPVRARARGAAALARAVHADGAGARDRGRRGAALVFGASMALGAFLAGMVVGQSPVSQQAAADALPLRDAFAVLFFVSVGMLFDPAFLLRRAAAARRGARGSCWSASRWRRSPSWRCSATRPARRWSSRSGSRRSASSRSSSATSRVSYGLLSDTGHSLLVACALVSITLNPILFASLDRIEAWLRRRATLWRALNAGSAAPRGGERHDRRRPWRAPRRRSRSSSATARSAARWTRRCARRAPDRGRRPQHGHGGPAQRARAGTRSSATQASRASWSRRGSRAPGTWWSRCRTRSTGRR